MYPQQYPPQFPQRPPPTKYAGLGCLAWIGVCFAIIAFGFIATCAIGIAKAPEDAKRAAEKADAAAQHAREQAADDDRKKAEDRKRCRIADGGDVFLTNSDHMRDICEGIISESLKVPGSGTFPTADQDGNNWVSYDGCSKTLQTYVDAQNAFGVKVRTRYECTFDPRTGIIRAKATD